MPTAPADLCELGQEQLMRMEYLHAAATLARAEQEAFAQRDWDLLARLYMPLQEARRQRRQRCGEGIVCLDLLATGPTDNLDPRHILGHYPHGQLLVAGWGSIEPAIRLREMADQLELYVETFLAAVYPTQDSRAVVIAPLPQAQLPAPAPRALDELRGLLPENCILLREDELPRGPRKGTFETYGRVMALWEKLHAPFLAAADAWTDPIAKIEAYRKTIRVDYACELAHQKLSDAARELPRGAVRNSRSPL
jgi:hypothetical protein